MEKLNYETIQRYQSFADLEEMDKAVRGFLYVHKSSFSQGVLKVLQFIWRHSVKVVGVSFAKYHTIAEAVQLSRRTVIRAVQKLEILGFLKKIATARMNGKQGMNLLVIQPFPTVEEQKNNMSPQDVTPSVTPIKTEKKHHSLCENKHNEKNVKKPDKMNTNKQLDISYLPESVHPKFSETASPFFYAIDIYKLWQRALIAYRKSKLEKPLEEVIEIIVCAFKQTVFMQKAGEIHTTFEGYFYSVVYAKLVVTKRQEYRHFGFDIFNEFLNGNG
ncbi:helix-turn-helix domain-containing protein [Bacillus sp. DTU_2020_1000418_1_SI_GHA_SEK_038]|uniref:helix-turn-helix domain-containing protein n=1 Tax=Bacillus sp. DTU_2020_1000418_1_SI_GHA_SEK_038 TaxID=3077585 RepID=UPI0028E19B6D|nr:helix-turn-helix domain-containing protein [Bacillus sp. DTU_2020_1000418_1_SI_GHA_SEK_038]WNS73660.1 helix-turn-helix domain-containing protein [Bacillus sp. DTU_2020_1000418_1_SI_GHA_SEK_038]